MIEKLKWALAQSKRDDFVSRFSDELYRKGVLALRWFASGDVYSPAMALKMIEIANRSRFCKMWCYSRSWRIETIEPLLRAMAALPNMSVFYSCDEETGLPVVVPENVQIAWMQTDADDPLEDERLDLVFRDYPLRKEKIPLQLADLVCPTDDPDGKKKGVTCVTCGRCIPK